MAMNQNATKIKRIVSSVICVICRDPAKTCNKRSFSILCTENLTWPLALTRQHN